MKRSYSVIACLMLLAAQCVAGQARSQSSPAIHFSPEQALMDDVVSMKVSGLPPGEVVTIKAQATPHGRVWQSQATFTADKLGIVDLSKQAPTGGSYAGVDPMGMFWSMKPDPTAPQPQSGHTSAPKITDPYETSFDVEIGGRTVASANSVRWWVRPGVRVTEVREDGLVGRLFEPEAKGRHPALMILSGSEGGISERDAALLASRGYTAFALAYFGVEGLPKQLVNIPIDYLKRGIDWLRARDSVDADRMGVMGGSKGGELGLLLGSMFPELKVVIAKVPSNVVWQGITMGGSANESSWSYQGKPLTFVPYRTLPSFTAQFSGKEPIKLVELYRPSLENKEAAAAAAIPVEKINGAVLLISGKDDLMWPSSLMADMVIERLKAHKHRFPYQHLAYDSAGHGIFSAYIPTVMGTGPGRFALGGTPEGTARAIADSRPKTLRFLEENLVKRK